jgi:exodeoxyribonuclease VII large subunit
MSQPSFDLDLDDGGLPTLTVRELAEAINSALRRSFFEGVWVRGEVQGLSERNGHLYFTLADDGEDGKATIAVSLFANVRFKLRPLLQRHRLRLADGLKVRIHGYPDLFAPTGRLSLKMSGIDPRYTLGELALQRDELVRRLVAEGLYDAQSRLAVPTVPLRVGVVTSVGSAAWHDVTGELSGSGFGFRVVACDTRVQGEWAAEMVAAALGTLAARPLDVVLVVRGGGARADLATFDSEVVARAIAGCPVPVLTGLGHEVDRSVADEVACLALKTPTACAAELVGKVRRFRAAAEDMWTAVEATVAEQLAGAERSLGGLARQAARQTRGSLAVASARLTGHADRLPRDGRRTLDWAAGSLERAARRGRLGASRQADAAAAEVGTAAARLRRRAPALGRAETRALDALDARMQALDPARTLARGWSITRAADGRVVRSASEVSPGDELRTTLAAGEVRSRVEESTP